MQSKKQGGLQKVFVKFSLDLKGQRGPFFAKQEKKGEKQSLYEEILQIFAFITSARKEPAHRPDVVSANLFLSSPRGDGETLYRAQLSKQGKCHHL